MGNSAVQVAYGANQTKFLARDELIIGVMMMELTEDELLSYQSQASGLSPATVHIQQDSQCTTPHESDNGSQEKNSDRSHGYNPHTEYQYPLSREETL